MDIANKTTETAAVDYGFVVGDTVTHIGDNAVQGIVTELDSDYDLGGITTCRVVWDAATVAEALATPRDDQDIQWTNKLLKSR